MDENTFTHNIIPSYEAGEDIYCNRPRGGTGYTNEDGDKVEWQDVNNGMRWWLED